MIEREVRVVNELGLHARAAARLVEVAGSFRASVTIMRGTAQADAKSLLGLLTLAAGHGSRLKLYADGADADEAIQALARLIENGFNEGAA